MDGLAGERRGCVIGHGCAHTRQKRHGVEKGGGGNGRTQKRVATGGDPPPSHLPSFFFLFHDLVRATPGVEVPTVHAEDELDRSRREDGSDMRFYGRKWSH